MPYLANTPEPSIDARDRFIGDGVKTVFGPLSRRPSGQGGLLVMINGVVQDGLTYGFAGNTLTFTHAPPAPFGGAFTNIEVVYLRTSSAPQSVNWATPIGSNSGTSDAIAINYTPVVYSLTDNLVLKGIMVPGVTNGTPTPTFSPSGITPKTIINGDGSRLVVGQLSGTFELRYSLGLDKWVIIDSVPTFIQLGTGAVVRTSQDKMRESVSILDFYANGVSGVKVDPTGVVNSTLGIQAAINASNRVYVPSGTYLTDTLTLRSNTYLVGEGGASILKQNTVTSASYGTLHADSGASGTFVSNIIVRDLQVLGQVGSLGFSEFQYLVSLNGVENVLIDRCWITGFLGDGVYIGSGTSAGIERHNKNVTIRDCVIDGVNNDNRNGVSVIDGDGVLIEGNHFKNCTRSNMPGAIDVEPNGDLFSVVRNITVSNNRFTNCTGYGGLINFIVGAAAFTTPPCNFSAIGNTASNASTSFLVFSPQVADRGVPINLVMAQNTYNGSGRPFDFSRPSGGFIDGVSITGNTFKYGYSALLAFTNTETAKNVTIANNVFNAVAGGIALNGSGSYVAITNNVFSGAPILLMGVAGGTTSNLSLTGNLFNGSASVLSSGTDDGSTNVFLNNIITGAVASSFRAWRTDYCGAVANGVSPITFNTTTLPDSFPPGISYAILNGDTGVPAGTGGSQGTLITYRLTDTAGYNHFTYQQYWHANNTLKLGSFFLRRRNQAANSWTSWFEQAS